MRSPSGVTRTRHRAVAGPVAVAGVENATPDFSISLAKRAPQIVVLNLPYEGSLRAQARGPTIVLAAEPPDEIVAGPISA